jgi:hypothetical protein
MQMKSTDVSKGPSQEHDVGGLAVQMQNDPVITFVVAVRSNCRDEEARREGSRQWKERRMEPVEQGS